MQPRFHRSSSLLVLAAGVALAVAHVPAASDWPQFLGPGRNGVYGGPAPAENWGSTGPKVVWRKLRAVAFKTGTVNWNLDQFHVGSVLLAGVGRPSPALAEGMLSIRNEHTLLCLDLRR